MAGAIFDVTEGQVVSKGRLVHVRVPDATNAAFFFRKVDGRRTIALGTDDGTHPRPVFGPDCPEAPCVVADEFTVQLGTGLGRVSDGPGDLIVVSPIGSGNVVGTKRIYWAKFPPRATIQSPAFGARIRPGGTTVLAHTRNKNVVDIQVFAVTPFTRSCASGAHVPPFEQHWLGNGLRFHGHSSCAPTSMGALLQYLDDNGLATVVPAYGSDCTLVEECTAPENLVPYRCLVTDLGKGMDTNGVTSGPPHFGSTDQILVGTEAFLNDKFGYVNHLAYEGNNDLWGGAVDTGFPPSSFYEEYAAGGPFIVGFSTLAGAEVPIGHYVVVDGVTMNADLTAELTVMDPHFAADDSAPACGLYKTYHVRLDGTMDYTLYPDNLTQPVALGGIVTLRFADRDPGCGEKPVPVAGKMINLKWWEGHFTPSAPGPYLLISESRDQAGHVQRDYQYVVAAGP
jgi:hypothetical protein